MFFYDVDTGIVLFEMPEMFHAEPHEITEDDFIDRIVGGNEKRHGRVFLHLPEIPRRAFVPVQAGCAKVQILSDSFF